MTTVLIVDDQPLRRLGFRMLLEATPGTEVIGEILVAIGHGWTNGEIAERLVLSESTVKSYFGRVLAKIGARDRIKRRSWPTTSAWPAPMHPADGTVLPSPAGTRRPGHRWPRPRRGRAFPAWRQSVRAEISSVAVAPTSGRHLPDRIRTTSAVSGVRSSKPASATRAPSTAPATTSWT